MTGYGQATRSTEAGEYSVEIKSVNNRYLEINTSVPGALNALEPAIKRAVAQRAQRGKVDVLVRFKDFRADVALRVNRAAISGIRDVLEEIRDACGIAAPVALRDILAFDGAVLVERPPAGDEHWGEIQSLVEVALDQWGDARTREGHATKLMIVSHLERIGECNTLFAEAGPRVEHHIGETVRKKFNEIVGPGVDQQRVYAEIAALVLKHATHEEHDRLASHIDAFSNVLAANGPHGKRLDFICQEMNREINTMGSKTPFGDIQAAVVDAKDALEAIREQVRNVE